VAKTAQDKTKGEKHKYGISTSNGGGFVNPSLVTSQANNTQNTKPKPGEDSHTNQEGERRGSEEGERKEEGR